MTGHKLYLLGGGVFWSRVYLVGFVSCRPTTFASHVLHAVWHMTVLLNSKEHNRIDVPGIRFLRGRQAVTGLTLRLVGGGVLWCRVYLVGFVDESSKKRPSYVLKFPESETGKIISASMAFLYLDCRNLIVLLKRSSPD